MPNRSIHRIDRLCFCHRVDPANRPVRRVWKVKRQGAAPVSKAGGTTGLGFDSSAFRVRCSDGKAGVDRRPPAKRQHVERGAGFDSPAIRTERQAAAAAAPAWKAGGTRKGLRFEPSALRLIHAEAVQRPRARSVRLLCENERGSQQAGASSGGRRRLRLESGWSPKKA